MYEKYFFFVFSSMILIYFFYLMLIEILKILLNNIIKKIKYIYLKVSLNEFLIFLLILLFFLKL